MSRSKASRTERLLPGQFHFYGGKGGVGKTTCAAAHAIAAARAGARVLVVSTDPAHSLGDALGIRLSARAATIAVGRPGSAGRPRLQAVELDAARAFRRWLDSHRAALRDAVEHGTWLDRDDIAALLQLPVPGIDELAGMLEIVRLSSSSRHDVIVVDTAPTGHALRLLEAPDTVEAVAAILDQLQQEHRRIREQFARVRRADAADRLVALLARQAADTHGLLRDASRTHLHWVMLPEELSLSETRDALAALRASRIPVRSLVINRMTPDGPPCRICSPRRKEERRVVARAVHLTAPRAARGGRGSSDSAMAIRQVPAADVEPRGVGALRRLSRYLIADPVAPRRQSPVSSVPAVSATRSASGPRYSVAFPRPTRLLFLGGKGGVGKTTIAAAIAVQIARADPDRKVLLLSTDPAHSLGDVLAQPLGDRPRAIRGAAANLRVREIDAAAALRTRREQLQSAVQEIADTAGALELVGGQGASRLMDLAPPGVDELLGLVSILEWGRAAGDVVVIDTAPTGHALRLLEMPDTARAWVQTMLRMLLKYRNLVRPGRLASELVELSKSIVALQRLIRDPGQSHFIVVTRAAALPRLETERLLARLRRLQLDVPILMANAVTTAPGRCLRCRRIAGAERRELARLARAGQRAGDCVIIQTPLIQPPPRGVAALDRWAREWIRIR